MGSSRDGHWLTVEERHAARGPLFSNSSFKLYVTQPDKDFAIQNKFNVETCRARIGKVTLKKVRKWSMA